MRIAVRGRGAIQLFLSVKFLVCIRGTGNVCPRPPGIVPFSLRDAAREKICADCIADFSDFGKFDPNADSARNTAEFPENYPFEK